VGDAAPQRVRDLVVGYAVFEHGALLVGHDQRGRPVHCGGGLGLGRGRKPETCGYCTEESKEKKE